MTRYAIVGLGLAALLGACAGSSDSDIAATPAAGNAAATAPSAADYVARAGASDLFEIQSSQLALQKAQSAAVKSFAQMMVSHHTNTTAQVTAAARKPGMNPAPPALPADKQRMLTALQSASGAAFDTLYAQQQVTGHQEALALHQSFAQGGSDPNLKAVAATAVPIVQAHLDRARRLPNG